MLWVEPYATVAELETWAGEPFPNAERLLVEASAAIDAAIIGAVYDTDDKGFPTDPEIRDALKSATCAQATWFGETGGAGGASAFGTLRFDTDAGVSRETSPSAVYILAIAGLLHNAPRVVR